MKFKTIDEAANFICKIALIDKGNFPGELGLTRTKYFLKLLGNPQNKLKVIHIAGSSGKGSTSYLISHLLQSLGFKTGLSLSPHLLDLRERFQINNKLISEKKFIQFLNEILPAFEKTQESKYGPPTYFETMIGLAFHSFYKQKVHYAVIETGLGGELDATNTIFNPDKVVVLTKMGLDHTHILGETLSEITKKKAGIMQESNLTISAWNNKKVREIIERKAYNKKTKVIFIKSARDFSNTKIENLKTIFNYHFQNTNLNQLELKLIGLHQAENCSLALTTIKILSERDRFNFDEKNIRKALKEASFKGRFEIKKYQGKTIILDGAHNPQKIDSLIKTLKKIYKSSNNSENLPLFHFLIAFKKTKNICDMLKSIIPLAKHITFTDFSTKNLKSNLSISQTKLKEYLIKLNFKKFNFITPIESAFGKSIMLHQKSKIATPLIITGSLYLLSEIYQYLKN